MNFFEVLNNIKNIVKLIDKYDDPVKETIKSMEWIFKFFKLDTVILIIDTVLAYEPKVLLMALNIIEQIEKLGLPGTEKLSKAVEATNENILPNVSSPAGLINSLVKVINIFAK